MNAGLAPRSRGRYSTPEREGQDQSHNFCRYSKKSPWGCGDRISFLINDIVRWLSCTSYVPLEVILIKKLNPTSFKGTLIEVIRHFFGLPGESIIVFVSMWLLLPYLGTYDRIIITNWHIQIHSIQRCLGYIIRIYWSYDAVVLRPESAISSSSTLRLRENVREWEYWWCGKYWWICYHPTTPLALSMEILVSFLSFTSKIIRGCVRGSWENEGLFTHMVTLNFLRF